MRSGGSAKGEEIGVHVGNRSQFKVGILCAEKKKITQPVERAVIVVAEFTWAVGASPPERQGVASMAVSCATHGWITAQSFLRLYFFKVWREEGRTPNFYFRSNCFSPAHGDRMVAGKCQRSQRLETVLTCGSLI